MRLPIVLERVLNTVIVTPRMHGIHHSIVERETNANWSVLFSCWDRLHRSLRLDVRQDAVVIGLPAHGDGRELGVTSLLVTPFREQASAWRLPSGARPEREIVGDPPATGGVTARSLRSDGGTDAIEPARGVVLILAGGPGVDRWLAVGRIAPYAWRVANPGSRGVRAGSR